MMLVGLETAFPSQFHISSMEWKSCIFKFDCLRSSIEEVVQSFTLNIFQRVLARDNYIHRMSEPGTWCDNIIISGNGYTHGCVIHITKSADIKPDRAIITPAYSCRTAKDNISWMR